MYNTLVWCDPPDLDAVVVGGHGEARQEAVLRHHVDIHPEAVAGQHPLDVVVPAPIRDEDGGHVTAVDQSQLTCRPLRKYHGCQSSERVTRPLAMAWSDPYNSECDNIVISADVDEENDDEGEGFC